MNARSSVVIDANVVKAAYELEKHGTFATTMSPEPIFDALREMRCRIVLDDGDHIRHEWFDCTRDFEWFEHWYFTLAQDYVLAIIKADQHSALCKKLKVDYGVPDRENMWLAKTSATEAKTFGACVLLSEDIDWRDPTKKKSRSRDDYISGKRTGPVTKFLRKHGVHVLALCQWD